MTKLQYLIKVLDKPRIRPIFHGFNLIGDRKDVPATHRRVSARLGPPDPPLHCPLPKGASYWRARRRGLAR